LGYTFDNLTLSKTGGSVSFTGNTSVDNGMTVNGGAYDVSFTGGTNAITPLVTFNNTGTLTLGDGGDSSTFTGGMIATAPGSVTVNGTVRAGGSATMSLGDGGTPVTIAGNSTLGGNSTGLVTLGGAITIADGNTLTLGDGTTATPFSTVGIAGAGPGTSNITVANTTANMTFGGAVGGNIGTVTLTKSGGTVSSTANFACTTLTVNAGAYNLSFTGTTNSFTNVVTFNNTGTLTLGDAGDTLTFSGGLDSSGGPVSTVTVGGTIDAAGGGNILLQSSDTISTTAVMNGYPERGRRYKSDRNGQ